MPVETADNGPFWTPNEQNTDSANLSGAATALCAAPASGKRIRLDYMIVFFGAALTLTVTEETTGTVLFKVFGAANTSQVIPFPFGARLVTAGKRVMGQTGGAGNINIYTACHDIK